MANQLIKGRIFVLLVALFSLLSLRALANDATDPHGDQHDDAEFDAGTLIKHHIADSHEWHLFTVKEADHDHHVTIPLPVILFVPGQGLDVFMSCAFKAAEGDHGHGPKTYKNYKLEHGKIHLADGGEHAVVYDISITKNVASMMLSAVILLVIFFNVGKAYKNRGMSAPKGLQAAIEPIIVFVRDEVAKPFLHNKTDKFLPYLLTVFFFIWVNNLLGLLPAGANVTGNISVTMTLALFTFFITNLNGNKYYWGHIFNTPGAPWVIKFVIPLMPIVEIIGIFTKPFALMVRLFANITAGHIIILSLISLTFIFKSIFAGIGGALFASALFGLELLVAVLQAYVFTLLSAVFIGAAVTEHH